MADAVVVVAGALQVASFVLGAGANALALLAFYRRRRRVAVSDRFVVNLLTGSLVTALALPPLALTDVVGVAGGGGRGEWAGLCATAEAIAAVSATLPPLAVLLLAGDQALAVLQPLRYRARLDTPRAAGLMLAGWALALAFGALSALRSPSPASLWVFCRCVRDGHGGDDVSGFNATVAGGGFSLLFLLPFGATALIYARISGAARRNSQQAAGAGGGAGGGGVGAYGQPPPSPCMSSRNTSTSSSSRITRQSRSSRASLVSSIRSRLSNASMLGRRPETRAAKVSALVVLLALGCWLPYHALALARALSPSGAREMLPSWLDVAALALVSAAAPLSPSLFAFRSRRLRRELRRILRLPAASPSTPNGVATSRPLLRRYVPPPPPPSPLPDAPPPPPPTSCAPLLALPAHGLPPGAPRGSISSGSTQGTTSTDD